MILVDTSVWIAHLRRSNDALVAALDAQEVITHPFVIGELACGEIRNRREVLDLVARLPSATTATDDEALQLIEERRLMGEGIGYLDVHLLASAILTQAQLWTYDKRLARKAISLRLGFEER